MTDWNEGRHPKEPRISVPPPGPLAARVLERDGSLVSQGGVRPYRFVMQDGRGCWARDVDGNLFLDFTSGIGVLATGHCHPRIIEAIHRQVDRFLHISSAHHTYEVMVSLAERVGRSIGFDQPARVFFANSGTEAVEGATKLARWFTRRPYVVSFFGAFHGRTYGAVSISGLSAEHRRRVGPLLPSFFLPYPDAERGITSSEVLSRAEELFQRIVPPDEIAAIVVEAVQGGAGPMSIPDEQFLPLLRSLADQHGFLLIVDEIYAGVGRTGEMWAHQHWPAQPDILCFAKSIASGMPLGGFAARAGVMEWPRGSHNSTFGGNPVSCAAAHATLDLVENGLVENARRLGPCFLDGLQALARKYPALISHVSGKGLMLYVELQSPEIARQALAGAFANGLLLLAGGPQGLRLAPPLIVDDEEARVGLALLAQTFEQLAAG